jgi:outer membrane protein assembly factor BamB
MRKASQIVGLALALLALPARGDDWTGLSRDDARSRAATEGLGALSPLGVPLATGSSSAASPVTADGFLVTAGLDGRVRAFREDDRSLLWSIKLNGPIIATPAIDKGRVYVSSSGGAMSVLRLADGAVIWSTSSGSADQSSPQIQGTTLYQGKGFPQASVAALDVTSTSVLWNTPVEQVTYSSPALANGLVIVGCNSGRYYALNAVTGAVAWTFQTADPVGTASALALISANAVYLPSGPTLHCVDLNGVDQWSATCVDPSPPAGAQGVVVTASSPACQGFEVVYLVRFVYAFDLNNDGEADQRILREFACGVNPTTHAIQWQVLLGDVTVPDVNGVPPYALCPAPVLSASSVVCASSIDPTLRVLDVSTGNETASFALDAPCLASPIVSNARVSALTRAGTLYVYEGPIAQPAAATGLAPNGLAFTTTPPTLSWDPAGVGSTYRVRIASDGEYLINWDYEFVTTATSIPCPALPTGHIYTWGVRVQNAALAYAPWSTATFKQNVPPAPPSGLVADPKHAKVRLSWSASPSAGAVGYRVTYGPSGGVLNSVLDVGNVLTATIPGLANGTDYTFELRAIDGLGDLSTPVTVSATPVSAIHLGGSSFDTIAGALAPALPGQTVLLGADSFTVSATAVVPPGVQLRGAGALDTQVTAFGSFPMFDLSDGSTISQLSLSEGSVGVRVSGSNALIRNCVLHALTQSGIEVLGTATIINNTIVDNAVAGVQSSGSAQARNNIVQGNGVGFLGAIVSRYNDVSDGYSGCSAGPGDRQSAVSFLDAPGGDYREQPQQASLDAGDPADDYSLEPALNGGRINMGAFGNTPLAATSLTAGAPPSKSSPGGGGTCGLLGLEALLVLAFARRRR